jgi:hypothetical protein
MRRARTLAVATLALLAASALGARPARAQLDATQWKSGTVDIDQGWKVHSGDNPVWAQPSFDDSQWQPVELDDLGAAEPGWHWFRRHITLAPGHPHVHLLIAAGAGTYELYIDGQKQPGPEIETQFAVHRPVERVIPVMDNAPELTLALRTYTPGIYATWHLPLFLTASLGTPGAIENERQAMESQRLYQALPAIAINLILILAAIAAFALYRSQRNHAEYLWLGLYLLLLGVSNLLLACVQTGLAPVAANNLIADPMVYLFTIAQIEFTFSFAGQPVSRPWRGYQALLLAPLLLNGLMWAGKISSGDYLLVETFVILPAAVLLPIFLLIWYRRGNREAGWLILPSLLPLATASLYDLGTVSIYLHWGVADFLDNPILLGPVSLQLADLGDFLFLLAIAVVMFLRFTRVSREQARAAAELQAARDIQQHLVPASLPRIAGYGLQAAYCPAEEVGGDFYQVIEQRDGATLIVIGDVSGKGLKAAMTGTLAIGALRSLADEQLAPAALLSRLNRQIQRAQQGGFVTCLCVRITADGHVTAANAGHLAPYRNGEELQIEPGFPLGLPLELAADEDYVETSLILESGDTLMFLSDGVVEAQNASGELFGFERTRAISRESAGAIALAAQTFGQADDITVLTLAYAGTAVPRA